MMSTARSLRASSDSKCRRLAVRLFLLLSYEVGRRNMAALPSVDVEPSPRDLCREAARLFQENVRSERTPAVSRRAPSSEPLVQHPLGAQPLTEPSHADA